MAPVRIQDEVKISKPLPLEVEVHLNLTRTQAMSTRPFEALFRAHGLTPVTYNILRILRGAGKPGLPCGDIAKRMVTRVPDVTRLVDRLVKLGHVARYRTEEDRRLVFQVVTEKGLALLASLDAPTEQLHKDQLKHFTKAELKTLNDLLVKARERLDA